jgi:hypothetical protein
MVGETMRMVGRALVSLGSCFWQHRNLFRKICCIVIRTVVSVSEDM